MTQPTNRAFINGALPEVTIDRHIYGHFAEHLGRCIYEGVWVGEDSPIPNTRGIRNDVVEALRQIRIPNLRWPGGCFADEYHWKYGVGPRDKRPRSINTHWGGVIENNHFGTHEFLDLCEQLDCEPYICGNVGSGTVEEMSQWVEYLTFDGDSSMAAARAENGRQDPWRLKFWGVGNENWGCGGNMRPEYYADLYRRYATYCRNLSDNKLYRIACGAHAADYRWTEVLMREAGRLMDGLSLHYYTVPGSWEEKGSATEFDEADWFTTLQKTFFMNELLEKHTAIMDKYDPQRRVALIVDEWGTWYDVEPGTNPGFLFQQNTIRDALVAASNLNIFNRYARRVRMANIAQTVNVLQAMILTEGEKMLKTPSYHVFDMYKVHQGATLLPMEIQTEQYEQDGAAIPAINGSASRDNDGKLHISLCNVKPNKALEFSVELVAIECSQVTGTILTDSAMSAHNTFEDPDAVGPSEFNEARLSGNTLSVPLPPMSVVVLEVQ